MEAKETNEKKSVHELFFESAPAITHRYEKFTVDAIPQIKVSPQYYQK